MMFVNLAFCARSGLKGGYCLPKYITQIENRILYNITSTINYVNLPFFIRSFPSKYLNYEIKVAHSKRKFLNNNFEQIIKRILDCKNCLALELKNICDSYKKEFINSKLNDLHIKESNIIKNRGHINDREQYNTHIISKYSNLHKNHWCTNLTDINIPTDVINFLSLGHNFNLNQTKHNTEIKKLILDVEMTLTNQFENKDYTFYLRNKIINCITNFINKNKNKSFPINSIERQIELDAKKTKKFFKENKQIIITKADKTNCTTLMTKEQYLQKLENHLNDGKTYLKIRKNHNDKIKEIKKEYDKLINELKKKKYISDAEKIKLNINNCNIARMYGLPKLHKLNEPIRPIIDNRNSPTEKLTTLLNPTLKILNEDNPYDLKKLLRIKR